MKPSWLPTQNSAFSPFRLLFCSGWFTHDKMTSPAKSYLSPILVKDCRLGPNRNGKRGTALPWWPINTFIMLVQRSTFMFSYVSSSCLVWCTGTCSGHAEETQVWVLLTGRVKGKVYCKVWLGHRHMVLSYSTASILQIVLRHYECVINEKTNGVKVPYQGSADF